MNLQGCNWPPAVVLTVRPGPYLETGWASYLGPLVVSCKVCDGASVWRTEPAAIAAATRAAGRPLWGWGYHYLSKWRSNGAGGFVQRYPTDNASAEAEGKAAGDAARLWDCPVYYCNAEDYAFGAWGKPVVANVAEAVAAFVAAFKLAAPNVALVWNGIAWVRYLDTAGNWRVGLTPASMAGFSWFAPMIYKLGADTVARRESTLTAWRDSAAKSATFGLPFGPMVASGALDDKGQAWAWHFDKGGAPGLVSCCAVTRPHVLAIFYGAGSSPALSAGNAKNAALWRLPPWVQLARGEGSAFAGTAAHPEMTPGAGGA